jgi:hypothetical protein
MSSGSSLHPHGEGAGRQALAFMNSIHNGKILGLPTCSVLLHRASEVLSLCLRVPKTPPLEIQF